MKIYNNIQQFVNAMNIGKEWQRFGRKKTNSKKKKIMKMSENKIENKFYMNGQCQHWRKDLCTLLIHTISTIHTVHCAQYSWIPFQVSFAHLTKTSSALKRNFLQQLAAVKQELQYSTMYRPSNRPTDRPERKRTFSNLFFFISFNIIIIHTNEKFFGTTLVRLKI